MQEWQLFLSQLDQLYPGRLQEPLATQYHIKKFDAQNLYLNFPDLIALNFFKEHIGPHLKHFKNSNQRPIKVHLELESQYAPAIQSSSQAASCFNFPKLDETYFEDFIVDEGNRFPFDLFHQLKTAQDSYNPIYLYGPKSCGKTHLLKAATHYYTSLGLKCLYVDAHTFSEHVVYAMKQSLMTQFRQLYRQVEMLFFDNVHLLESKPATQEEFFHTFNSLHMASKPIVMASNAPPSFLKQIEPRLISRFEWGLCIELTPLSPAYYQALINSLSKKLQLPLTLEHQKSLLTDFSSNTSTLCNALHALALRSHLDQDTHLTQGSSTLAELKTEKKELTLDQITGACGLYFKLLPKQIKGPCQTKDIGLCRQMTMYLIRKHLNLPYKKIGQYFDRDHSTVMASVTVIEQKLKLADEQILNALKRIEWSLKD